MHKLTSMLLAFVLAVPTHAQDKDLSKVREAAQTALANADWDNAIANLKKLTEADAKDAGSWLRLGYALHAKGDLDEALKVHKKAAEFPQVAPTATYNIACVYARQGKKDEALNWLEKAAQVGFTQTDHMESDNDMDSLRGEPRYKEIVAKMEKSATASPQVTVYAGTFDRKLARMVLFAGKGSLGGVSISYGQPQWKDEFEKQIESPKSENRRWRFGKDEWTTLDTSVPLKIGDKQLDAGVYYLTLERHGNDFVLAALDPATVHKKTIDPFFAQQTSGGTEIVMKHEMGSEVVKQLEIKIVESMGNTGAGDLVVRFGPHKLTTRLELVAKGLEKADKNAK